MLIYYTHGSVNFICLLKFEWILNECQTKANKKLLSLSPSVHNQKWELWLKYVENIRLERFRDLAFHFIIINTKWFHSDSFSSNILKPNQTISLEITLKFFVTFKCAFCVCSFQQWHCITAVEWIYRNVYQSLGHLLMQRHNHITFRWFVSVQLKQIRVKSQ